LNDRRFCPQPHFLRTPCRKNDLLILLNEASTRNRSFFSAVFGIVTQSDHMLEESFAIGNIKGGLSEKVELCMRRGVKRWVCC